MASLLEDNARGEKLGREPEPSDKSLALAGLSREKFLQMSEKAAANFSPHSLKGKTNLDKLSSATGFENPVLDDMKTHMVGLTSLLKRSEVSKLSKHWDVGLELFKCQQCSRQQKDLSTKLRRCGGCGETFYCSKECQQIHWKSSHKKTCTKITVAAPSTSEAQ